MRERTPTLGEEIANSVSHGVGLMAALGAVPALLVTTVRRGDAAITVGASIFALTMILVYLTSTVYHALPRNRAKRVLQVLDHGAIFLLIAGTYTPFTLGVLKGAWGWTLLTLVWALGLTGIAMKAVAGVRYPRLSIGLYLATGWSVIVAAKPVCLAMSPWGLFWLIAGGVFYTAGVPFFTATRLPYGHLVWHLCVMAGTACHFVAVTWYAA